MNNFFIQSYATYKGLFYWLSWPGYLSNILLRPIVVVILYALLGKFAINPDVAQDFALGVSVHSMVFVLLGGITQSYTYERSLGTMAFLYVSPANRLMNFLSRLVFHYPNAILTFAIGLLTAWLVIDMDFSHVHWPYFLLSFLITAASITIFGQFLGIFSIVFRDWFIIFGMTNGILLAFTGVLIPITVFPSAMQEVIKLLPMTNGLAAIKIAFNGVISSDTVILIIIREGLTGLGYFIMGYIGFIGFERVAKQKGSLELEAF